MRDRRMILFYGEGRIGNQIFQYQALSQLCRRGERILAVGLEDLQSALELRGPTVVVFTRNRIVKRAVKYCLLPLLLRPLARTLRLISYGFESTGGIAPRDGAGGELNIRVGLFARVTFVDGGHYQNSSYWTSLFPALSFLVSGALRLAARRRLDSLCKAPQRTSFVHVRRKDYLVHTAYGLDELTLPLEFYRCAIAELERRIGQTHLVFVTDDPRWVEENFADISAKSIVSSDVGLDFAIMTECRSGIVSNSTFALAAACMLNDPEVVIAPKYWLGFRVGCWYPTKIRFEHPKIIYLPVPWRRRSTDFGARAA
jgi:hypothetical protein